jgi:hypothetical protein
VIFDQANKRSDGTLAASVTKEADSLFWQSNDVLRPNHRATTCMGAHGICLFSVPTPASADDKQRCYDDWASRTGGGHP